ncbi:MAG: neutral/alkaline non-lysosomal ceramidase N-terminal domain-containing protein, partial [Deltaproteobacteria bacterium]|nr:neutral/alkaline non-lysosomal ceramidase N-terminal domain-containing protein [Deltaproteobacteria bacterium]
MKLTRPLRPLVFSAALLPQLVACSSDSEGTKADATSPDGGTGGTGGSGGDSGATCASGSPVEGWEVGVAVEDLSPTEEELATGEIYMGAYGIGSSRGAATAVHDRIYSRAMVLRSGCESIAMVILDTPGNSNRVLAAIAEGVAEKTTITREGLYVGATHSHSSPDLQGLWGGVSDAYKARLISLVVQSVTRAYEAAVPADVTVSRGTGPNRNRRDWNMTDDELTVLDAKAKDGSRIGTLVNFAAHPVVLGMSNREISRDFCGYTVDSLEESLGAKDRVLFFNGAQGDASPDGGEGDGFARAESYGNLLADAARAAMDAPAPVSPGLVIHYLPWKQEVTNTNFRLMNELGFLDYDAESVDNTMAVNTQAAYVQVGDALDMVVFPGEALTRTGLAVKERMTSPHRL